MLSPHTAPRWKRHTKPGRQQAAWGGKGSYEVKAARARKSGSRPKLTKAKPPDFTKTLREIDMFPSSCRCGPLPPSAALCRPCCPIVSETPVRLLRGRRPGHALARDRRCLPTHV